MEAGRVRWGPERGILPFLFHPTARPASLPPRAGHDTHKIPSQNKETEIHQEGVRARTVPSRRTTAKVLRMSGSARLQRKLRGLRRAMLSCTAVGRIDVLDSRCVRPCRLSEDRGACQGVTRKQRYRLCAVGHPMGLGCASRSHRGPRERARFRGGAWRKVAR